MSKFSYIKNENYQEDFMCSICLNPWTKPYEHTTCGTIYCYGCMLKSENPGCPKCHINDYEWRTVTNNFIKNKLNEIDVQCNECDSEMKRCEFEKHLESDCMKKCQHCHLFKSSVGKLKDHESKCPSRNVYCPGKDIGCSWYNPAGWLENHEEECEYIRTKAIFEKLIAKHEESKQEKIKKDEESNVQEEKVNKDEGSKVQEEQVNDNNDKEFNIGGKWLCFKEDKFVNMYEIIKKGSRINTCCWFKNTCEISMDNNKIRYEYNKYLYPLNEERCWLSYSKYGTNFYLNDSGDEYIFTSESEGFIVSDGIEYKLKKI